ncbi:MAG: DUF72 domain-containing protein [Elusimicrobia bacterium]|nr:DUF72 domain-containing protein [Elusimicrobiota bacterium]
MKCFIGTSGFSYREWKPAFYPADLPSDRMLSFYADRFPTVEVNNTFYRMPKEESLRAWSEEVPAGFVFSFKAPQIITHMKRLKNVEEPVERFASTVSVLGSRLGPLLFGLPPNMKADVARLGDFLSMLRTVLPKNKCAVEFRNPSWFSDEVFSLLEKARVALCFNDADVVKCPLVATADWGYLRLRRVRYAPKDMKPWAKKIAAVKKWKEAFVYFKHEESASAPKWAAALSKELA